MKFRLFDEVADRWFLEDDIECSGVIEKKDATIFDTDDRWAKSLHGDADYFGFTVFEIPGDELMALIEAPRLFYKEVDHV